MKTMLQLQLRQHLVLTQSLQQALRFLQLSTQALNQEIQQTLESNPLLESEEETQNTVKIDEHWTSDYYTTSRFLDPVSPEELECAPHTLRDNLYWQLTLTPCTEEENAIGVAIIDAIDPEGTLTLPLEDLIQNFLNPPPTIADAEVVLHRIQRFDPIGCGTRSLRECLLVQLDSLPKTTPFLNETRTLLQNDLTLLAAHNYKEIQKKYDLNTAALHHMLQIILSLHPKPGNRIGSLPTEYIVPDLIVRKYKEGLQVALNPHALPHLHINTSYTALMRGAKNAEDTIFIKNNHKEARFFLKSIENRQDTLLKTARYLIEYQKDFLTLGERAMKPLTLNEVAQALQMHESTLSRITTKKYIDTPRGIFELKYLLSNRLGHEGVVECSSKGVSAVIKAFIEAENTKTPLSDREIVELLKHQGMEVARRTVAKYRESMGFAPSYERKALTSSGRI